MDLAFPLLAFAGAFLATNRSLGWGFVAVFAVGYVNGVVRANFLSVATTFMFDAAVLGLYAGFFLLRWRQAAGVWSGSAGQFVLFLIAWPALLVLVPINSFLVQLVALRASVWFLPVALLATRLTVSDLAAVARGLAVLNLGALAVGAYLYVAGVEALYPENAVTQTIYASKDVAGTTYYRIPSTFLNAHAYGGAMLFSLPFLIDRVFGPRVRWLDRGLALAGMAAAAAGILLCAARQPLVVFAVSTVVAWACTRFSLGAGLVVLAVTAAITGLAASNERLQRGATLEDPEVLSRRVQASANESFFDLLVEYPAGAGMGSSFGTSIPYFLASQAPTPIGMENEFSRILVDQGWVGLTGWLAFLAWLLVKPPAPRLAAPWQIGAVVMYALVLTNWLTAFIGAGTLSTIPTSVMLLTQTGVLIAVRERGTVPGALPPPRPRP